MSVTVKQLERLGIYPYQSKIKKNTYFCQALDIDLRIILSTDSLESVLDRIIEIAREQGIAEGRKLQCKVIQEALMIGELEHDE